MTPGEPPPTGWDLNFNLFGIPVRIHPMFWLVTVILQYDLINAGLLGVLAVWVACVFVSILVHELGHVLVGRAFGSEGHIVLHSFGGLAVGSTRSLNRWQRILVLFAGPGAGFVFCAAVWAASEFAVDLSDSPALVDFAVSNLIWINLVWGLINLLPVWPLDGGQISGEVCSAVRPRGGERIALILSIVIAVGIAAISLAQHLRVPLLPFRVPNLNLYTAILFAYLAYISYDLLQQIPRDPWRDERMEQAPWERDPDEWQRR
jgi:Zn-dependent protease